MVLLLMRDHSLIDGQVKGIREGAAELPSVSSYPHSESKFYYSGMRVALHVPIFFYKYLPLLLDTGNGKIPQSAAGRALQFQGYRPTGH